MIEHFPLKRRSKVFMPEDLQHVTRGIVVDGLSFPERAAAHYTAYLQDRTIKRNHTRNGDWFCFCIYDALVACGVTPERIIFNTRASKERNDDIDLLIEPCLSTQSRMCLYLKTSLRERWKQVDRDARIAKDIFGKNTMTVCLSYAEDGAAGFVKDCTHLKTMARIHKKFALREEWAYGVDVYAALSQTTKVNRLMASLIEDAGQC